MVDRAGILLASEPARAAEIAKGIKEFLDSLHPQPESDHGITVLYPAIKSAMDELQSFPARINWAVDRAYNLLHDAFWSETPAPASAPTKRPQPGQSA